MTAQSLAEKAEFLLNPNDDEPYPEGYEEALAGCHALAVDLLRMALDREVKRCWDCNSWIGRCLKGKANRIAASEACSHFSQKKRRATK